MMKLILSTQKQTFIIQLSDQSLLKNEHQEKKMLCAIYQHNKSNPILSNHVDSFFSKK